MILLNLLWASALGRFKPAIDKYGDGLLPDQ